MNKEHYPAPWYNPELPGLHCANCAATVNLQGMESAGVSRGSQITYAWRILADNHQGRTTSCVETDDYPLPLGQSPQLALAGAEIQNFHPSWEVWSP